MCKWLGNSIKKILWIKPGNFNSVQSNRYHRALSFTTAHINKYVTYVRTLHYIINNCIFLVENTLVYIYSQNDVTTIISNTYRKASMVRIRLHRLTPFIYINQTLSHHVNMYINVVYTISPFPPLFDSKHPVCAGTKLYIDGWWGVVVYKGKSHQCFMK